MFTEISKTNFPPSEKPLLIWDGECGFCKYWKTRWKMHTGTTVAYKTYQNVASNFPDIPLKEFKKASRFIDLDGHIYSGPDSAFKSYSVANRKTYLHKFYQTNYYFKKSSNLIYNFIAKNRSTFYRVTLLFFGNDPKNLKPYWLLYLILIVSFIAIISAKI